VAKMISVLASNRDLAVTVQVLGSGSVSSLLKKIVDLSKFGLQQKDAGEERRFPSRFRETLPIHLSLGRLIDKNDAIPATVVRRTA